MRAELCPVGYKISDRPRTSLCCCEVGLIYRELLSVRTIDVGGKESFESSVNVPSHHLRPIFGLSFFYYISTEIYLQNDSDENVVLCLVSANAISDANDELSVVKNIVRGV